MNWTPTSAACTWKMGRNDPFNASFTPATEQVVVSDADTWVMINAAPLYFNKPNPDRISFANRVTADGYEKGRGNFDEALEVVREIASRPGADLELLARVLGNVMDPVALMVFIASIKQTEC